MNYHKIIFTYFLSLQFLCFMIGIAEGIVGGQYVKVGQIKYQLSLRSKKIHICGAAVVNKRHGLSAAHCVINKDNKFQSYDLSILYGVLDIGIHDNVPPNGVEVKVETVYAPASFRGDKEKIQSKSGDIIILKLESELKFGSNSAVDIVKLPKPTDLSMTYINMNPIISGFGLDASLRVSPSEVYVFPVKSKLKFGITTVLPNSQCELMYNQPLNSNQLCAQMKQQSNVKARVKEPEGACDGDDGGPLVLYVNKSNVTVIGVLSIAATDCNEKLKAAIYTKVSPYLGFIESVINNTISSDIRCAIHKNIRKLGLFGTERVLEEKPCTLLNST